MTGSPWCYGNLAVRKDGVSIITPDATPCGVYGQVDPDTVGQYTGLTDKNGQKIFEGDIVKVDGKHYEVKYVLGQFFVGLNMPIAYKRFECEVVGNIHDNPELLEVRNG